MIQQLKANLEISRENLTSDAGLLLLFKFLESINLRNKIDEIEFSDSRNVFKYSNMDLLLFKLVNIFAGYKSQVLQAKAIEDPLFNKFENIPS